MLQKTPVECPPQDFVSAGKLVAFDRPDDRGSEQGAVLVWLIACKDRTVRVPLTRSAAIATIKALVEALA
ncbi:hypothetical protein FHS85_001769 [Rhodoligotrophos appendicifer]|uniref:hypothetical protein n=1 Tax=Rhodoligotrophos appendicifer TaxID=987056 RepID=UPI0011849A9D|nr:hypothetical protein [Rhodoligotrophos appendicifer]